MKKTEIISKEIESFSKDIENVKKNQSENTKTKIRIAVDGLNCRIEGTKERNCEIKYRTIKLTSLNNREKHT